jgi:DNA-binding beta-propeller fold protein YncE
MNLDLANQDTLNVVLNTLKGQPPGTPGNGGPVGPFTRGSARDAAAAALPNLLPALADVPFLPYYPQSKVPPLPACTQATAPDVMMVNHASGTVTRYNSCTGANIAVIPVTSNPLQVELVADGSLALVTSFDGAVGFIDTASNTVTSLFTPGLNPSGVAISPDNTYAFITSFNDATPVLAKVDLTQRQVVKTLQMPFQYPQSVSFNPEGSQAYVMFPFTSTLVIVDTFTMTVARTIQLPGPAFGTVFNSTGTLAFVGVRSSPGQVLVINAATYQIQKSITVGDNPTDLKVMGSDQLLVVGNYYGQSLSFIFMPALALLNSVSVGGPPRGLVQVQ